MHVRPSVRRPWGALAAAAALAAALTAAPASRADVLELADGTTVEGKVIQEKDGFVWVRTLIETRKIAAADVKGRTARESPVDVLAALEARVAKDPRDVAALWEYYQFLAAHAEESKDLALKAKPLPGRIVKIDPEHEGAHDALGETKFEGKWVLKTDVPRLQAELDRRRRTEALQKQYEVKLELQMADHWELADNTGAKDLPKKAKELDDVYRICGEILGAERFWDDRATVVTFKRHDDYARNLDASWKAWNISQWRFEAARDPRNGGIWLHKPAPFQMRCIPESKADAEDGMWAAIVHNAVHVVIWSQPRASEPPAWFEEGLASMVETEVRGLQKAYCVGAQVSSAGKTTDKPRGGSKSGNKGLVGEQQVFKEHAKRAMDDGEFPEMRKFLRMKVGEFGPVEAGGALGMVTWLRNKDPEKFKQLWAEIRTGPRKDDDPWRKVYGWNLIEDMEKEFKVWVRSEW